MYDFIEDVVRELENTESDVSLLEILNDTYGEIENEK